jgi:hypothetical protein
MNKYILAYVYSILIMLFFCYILISYLHIYLFFLTFIPSILLSKKYIYVYYYIFINFYWIFFFLSSFCFIKFNSINFFQQFINTINIEYFFILI